MGAPPLFSAREREVLELLLQGHDRPAIAAALSLSPHTVAHHVEALIHGYGVPTVTVLVATVLGARLKAERAARVRCQRALAAIDERRGR